ncbi:MAG: hypothetical protein QGI45_02925 [Myxococcota bacterium]|nr:hypothetical protein [Myxococcota bacterium]
MIWPSILLTFCFLACEQKTIAQEHSISAPHNMTVSIKQVPPNKNLQEIFVWQGFKHQWLRQFLNFRIPHRISKLASIIEQPSPHPRFAMGQSTGVDGNHMRPEGFYSFFKNKEVHHENYQIRLEWDDLIASSPTPKSETIWQKNILLPYKIESHPELENQNFTALLNGFDLQTTCRQTAGRGCNSDGIWPYHFNIQIQKCSQKQKGLECPLSIEINRGWTPHHGGIPYLAPKPLNQKTHYLLNLAILVLRGAHNELYTQQAPIIHSENIIQDLTPTVSPIHIQGIHQQYTHGLLGIHGFGFTLNSLGTNWGAQHRGRYIDRLSFHIEAQQYNAKKGRMHAKLVSQIGAPKTVRKSFANYHFQTVLVQLGPSTENATLNQSVKGDLCRNSHNAPFFSRWKRCEKTDLGTEQSQDYVALDAHPFTTNPL